MIIEHIHNSSQLNRLGLSVQALNDAGGEMIIRAVLWKLQQMFEGKFSVVSDHDGTNLIIRITTITREACLAAEDYLEELADN